MNKEIIENSIYNILQEIEWYDVAREWLQDTPKRVAKAMEKVFEWYNQKPEDIMTVFENESQWIDQIVWLSNIEFYSFCEHHLLPFIGTATFKYLPNGKVIGLSKIPRIIDFLSRKPNIQENLTNEIYNVFKKILNTENIFIELSCEHLCAKIRGVKDNCIMTTQKCGGVFKVNYNK